MVSSLHYGLCLCHVLKIILVTRYTYETTSWAIQFHKVKLALPRPKVCILQDTTDDNMWEVMTLSKVSLT